MKSVIVGTAGHIDHGKTALVKALTGIDADRLAEEKRRGITIDIGFAHLELVATNGAKLRLGFVDVPGHERFVRNMLAGAGGIDLVVLIIAANEGIKPQTREHFDICRLLGVRRGITVLTKADTVDAETLEVVRLEVAEFLRGSFLDPLHSPIVAASALTGGGLDEVKAALATAALEVSAKDSGAIARLPIDRVFTMKGFGTVITGTLVSGAIRKEDQLQVFPSGRPVRVRGVQVHGSSADQAVAGQRTALNLLGASTEELARGMTLAPAETFRTSSRIDVRLSLLRSAKPLKDAARVHFHSYTSETIAEVRLYEAKSLPPGGEAFAQLRLAQPMLTLPGDRFVIRRFSPVVTIGGGVVLDAPVASRRRSAEVTSFLRSLLTGAPEEVLDARVARTGEQGLALRDLPTEMNLRPEEGAKLAARLPVVRCEDMLISQAAFTKLSTELVEIVRKFHEENPLVAGISKEDLRTRVEIHPQIFSSILALAIRDRKLSATGDLVHLPGRGVVMKDEEAESKKVIEQAFVSAGLKVPSLREVLGGLKVDKVRAQKIVTLLLRDKVLIKVSDELVFHHNSLSDLRQKLTAMKPTVPKIDVARFKDITGVSRKYAIPLLEYLDRERVTKRVGDERMIL